MAHECPECGECCYCGSDIDDCCHNFPEDQDNCTHCICNKCGETPDYCDCHPDDDCEVDEINQDHYWDDPLRNDRRV